MEKPKRQSDYRLEDSLHQSKVVDIRKNQLKAAARTVANRSIATAQYHRNRSPKIFFFIIVPTLASIGLGVLVCLRYFFINPFNAIGAILIASLFFISVFTGAGATLLVSREKAKAGESKAEIITRAIIGFLLGSFAVMPFIGSLIAVCFTGTSIGRKGSVKRGTELTNASSLQVLLNRRQAKAAQPQQPQIEIAGVKMPNHYENLGFFFVGSPGSGKSQAIAQMLDTLKQRPQFRGIIFDRNGELLEKFYDPEQDLLFNPNDARSLAWSHRYEGVRPETLAAALVEEDPKEPFFAQAARSLLSDLYERCDNNAQIWEVLTTFSDQELRDFVSGGLSSRYFINDRTGGSVLATLVNFLRFYRLLPSENFGFSFSNWGREDDPRWIFLPLFEDDAELLNPIYSAAFELVLKGLLSGDENRNLKTAIIIDELGALQRLNSLTRLLSESRKFGGCPILGTQTEAQITKRYGEQDTRIILQGTATKLILNCRDAHTAETMANLIGKQERIDITTSTSGIFKPTTQSEQIREVHAVMASELQALPMLHGYLTIADGTPPAKVQVQPRSYAKKADRLVLRRFGKK